MKNPLITIAEMIGRVNEDPAQKRFKLVMGKMNDVQALDYTRVDYNLTKALYYASTIRAGDGLSGKVYGKEFLFGAAFAKPIVNATAAFAFAKQPTLRVDGLSKDENQKINDWMQRYKKYPFNTARWSLRDGDGYIRILGDGSPYLVPASRVEPIVDPITGELTGYDVTSVVKESNGDEVKYVTYFRKINPFVTVKKFTKDNQENGVEMPDYSVSTNNTSEKRPLELIGFHNEVEAGSIYGNTEFQGVYFPMANYHALFENAIKNNIFNSVSSPFIKGVDNPQAWLDSNGFRADSDGNYNVKWDADKLFIGNKDFSVEFAKALQNANDTSVLLNLLFWIICQNSETPEFVMGTAVSSSKASVEEQMPVMLRKAKRKQTEYEESYGELGRVLAMKTGKKVDDSTLVDVIYPPILDDDKKVNSEVVKLLADEGCITDHTKMVMLSMGDYVEDIDAEIEKAHKEIDEKSALVQNNATNQANNEQAIIDQQNQQ